MGSSTPLTSMGGLRLDVEHASHVAVGVVTDAQCPARCGLLHACGDVDGDAANAAFAIDSAAQQHAAGVQAHTDIEATLAVLARHLVT
jgi:hypothetical protein